MKNTKLPGIYKIENLVNGAVYIGSAVNLSERHRLHRLTLHSGTNHNKHLQNAWNKYGENNFMFSIIEIVHHPHNLIQQEQLWMNYYDVMNVGYNLCPFAESQLGFKHSEEAKKRMSDAKKGDKHFNYGKSLSTETRTKISAARRNNPQLLRKLSEGWMGKNNPNYGKDFSEETRRKMSLAKSLCWEITDPKGQVYIIRNLSQFCKERGLSKGNMWLVAQGRRHHHKGWKCKKLTGDDAQCL